MQAIVLTEHGGPEVLEIRELPDPVPGPGEVLIRVRAFGLNHADTYMRIGVWAFGIPVLWIEAAGPVELDPSGRLAPGTKVIAIVGGMARERRRAARACGSSAPTMARSPHRCGAPIPRVPTPCST